MKVGFPIHGDYVSRVSVSDRIVVSDITGPWNFELVVEWGKTVELLFQQLDRTCRNGAIAHHHISILNTGEAVDHHRKIIAKGVKTYGLIAVASVVALDVEGSGFASLLLDKVYGPVVDHQIFTNYSDAYTWLMTKLSAS